MKRFIIISLLSLLTMRAACCTWQSTHNWYLFSLYDSREFSSRVNEVCMENWRAYLGSETGLNDSSGSVFPYYDADVIIAVAKKKGDGLMVSYVEQLERYLQCARAAQQESWDYPTKEELAQRKQTLLAVRTYAQGKLKTRLRSQHALLFMRCNMMLGRHSENIGFWEQTACNYIETVYKDMMKNIYAGALLKTGDGERAGAIFAEMGDWESLMTQYYWKRSCKAIREEYERDANSLVLPFLLQDFVNNVQEAIDMSADEWTVNGKLFVRDIQQDEAREMCKLAGEVVSVGRCRTPQMWQCAKAWLEYLLGDKEQAFIDIRKATTMNGTERMADNTRVLSFYISSVQTPVDKRFDDYVAEELTWLTSKGDGRNYYSNAFDRCVHQVLAEKYVRAGRPEVAWALFNQKGDFEYDEFVDTVSVEGLQDFIGYARSSATTSLDRFLKPRLKIDDDALTDLIGTKYMRLCKWEEALNWLTKVSLSYYNEKGYRCYAVRRRWSVEPWLRRQWLTNKEVYEEQQPMLNSNPKEEFAREMLSLESGLSLLTGRARQKRCYDLAVRLSQASFTGDCWFLMRDGKSVSDSVRVNEVNLQARALSLLQEAAVGDDVSLKELSLFARSYVYLYAEKDQWCVWEWNNETIEYVRVVHPFSTQYGAFAALADFERQNGRVTSTYVSRCDEYRQFLKLRD